MPETEIDSAFERALAAWKNYQHEDAKSACETVLQAAPNDVRTLRLLALISHQEGDNVRAVGLGGTAIALDPTDSATYAVQGAALHALRKWDAAIESYDAAIARDPAGVEAHINRGATLLVLDRVDDAIASYQNGIRIRPSDAKLHVILGTVLQKRGRKDEAEAAFRQAATLDPLNIKAHLKLADSFSDDERWVEAEASLRQAIALNFQDVDTHMKLATALSSQGRAEEAEAHYRAAVALRPDHVEAHSKLIFISDLTEKATTESLQAVRREWAAKFAPPNISNLAFDNSPDPRRRLQIGYVSGDFKAHSAAFIFIGMLLKFDSDNFEVFAYSNSAEADAVTQRIQKSVTWRAIEGLSDSVVANMIREDRIDVLVDLSGHSGNNRLRVFAMKPAPIQITAWGYITGTGLKTMDVIFADPVVIPDDEKHHYAEEVVNLPSVLCIAGSPTKYPPFSALPALSNGYVTFGSFNRLPKVSDRCVKTWAKVLAAVPGSRMIIKAPGLQYANIQQRLRTLFSEAGIESDRLIFMGPSIWTEHMAAFQKVDICLDAYPHSGGMTTLEGLMMGVPAVTLKWPTIVGRMSASFLTTLSLKDWIAETEDAFIAIAAGKANDLTALKELRQTLRGRVQKSALGDIPAYVAATEAEYRKLWIRWCAAKTA